MSTPVLFEKHLGIEVLSRDNGSAKVALTLVPVLTNPYGIMHGGAIASLADTAMANAVLSQHRDKRFYTVKLEVGFKAPVNNGRIIAEARITRKKQKFLFGEVLINDEAGNLVAQAQAKFYLDDEITDKGKPSGNQSGRVA